MSSTTDISVSMVQGDATAGEIAVAVSVALQVLNAAGVKASEACLDYMTRWREVLDNPNELNGPAAAWCAAEEAANTVLNSNRLKGDSVVCCLSA